MRLWSIHPKYLDQKGLVALWREGLLALKVLKGETKGYKNHPQLNRFKEKKDKIQAISYYLYYVWRESQDRRYHFNFHKIDNVANALDKFDENPIKVSSSQILYEFYHLHNKLKARDEMKYNQNMIEVQLNQSTWSSKENYEYWNLNKPLSKETLSKIINKIMLHPLFEVYESDKLEEWEKIKGQELKKKSY